MPNCLGEGWVSVVILNWNCEQFLSACIDSVLQQTYPYIDLMVMDNNSADHSLQLLRSRYPRIRVMVNPANLGFARAHNIAIRETGGEFYMPLNPDVVLSDTCIEEMIKAARSADNVGLLSGKVYFMDGQDKTDLLYSTGHLLTKNRKPSNRGYKQRDEGQYDAIEYVFGVNGACPLLCRVMLDDVAIDGEVFDETFFLYGDDYDLGWRAQLLGWKSLYVPRAIAYHHGKGSGGLDTPYVQFQYARNRYLEIYKNDLALHFLLDIPYILLYEVLWQGYTFITNPRRTIAHIRAVLDFIRLLPETHKKRKKIQARKRVTAQYMRSLFTGMRFR